METMKVGTSNPEKRLGVTCKRETRIVPVLERKRAYRCRRIASVGVSWLTFVGSGSVLIVTIEVFNALLFIREYPCRVLAITGYDTLYGPMGYGVFALKSCSLTTVYFGDATFADQFDFSGLQYVGSFLWISEEDLWPGYDFLGWLNLPLSMVTRYGGLLYPPKKVSF
ncbi:hypothetical protein Tco_0528657 [Tanacetum coccineum]